MIPSYNVQAAMDARWDLLEPLKRKKEEEMNAKFYLKIIQILKERKINGRNSQQS